MRRTKSHKLHPSAQTIASALSQYQDKDDEPIRYDGGGPEDSLWDGLPILPVPESWCIVRTYNFFYPTDVSLTTYWNQHKDAHGATIPTLANAKGGGMEISTGLVAGQGYNFVSEKQAIFSFVPGKTTWIEADFNMERGFCIGFGDTYTYDPAAGFFPVNPNNGFTYDLQGGIHTFNDGVYRYQGADGLGEEVFSTCNDYMKLGLRIEPGAQDPTKFDIYIFKDGEYSATYSNIQIPSDLAGIMFGNFLHNTTVTVRDVIVIQEKDTD